MKKFCKYLVLAFIYLLGTTACNNADRQVKLLEDIYTHSGRLRGYAAVYEIAFDGDIVRSDESFPVYENEDGTYTIVYHDDSYGLTELDNPVRPYEDGMMEFKYKLDYNHFIEKIPTSY